MSKFEALITWAEGERQLIWNRYTARLVAESVLVAAVSTHKSGWVQVLLAAAGLVIAALWAIMTIRAWAYMRKLLEESSKCVFANGAPVPDLLALYGKPKDVDDIRDTALLVIGIFGLINVILGVSALVDVTTQTPASSATVTATAGSSAYARWPTAAT